MLYILIKMAFKKYLYKTSNFIKRRIKSKIAYAKKHPIRAAAGFALRMNTGRFAMNAAKLAWNVRQAGRAYRAARLAYR